MEGKLNSGFTLEDEENVDSQELKNIVPTNNTEDSLNEHHVTSNNENPQNEHQEGINENQLISNTRFRKNIPSHSGKINGEDNLNEILSTKDNGITIAENNEEEEDKNGSGKKCPSKYKRIAHRIIIILLNCCVFAYFIVAVVYWKNQGECEFDWCDGLGMLLIILAFTYFGLIYYQVIKKYFGKRIYSTVFMPVKRWWSILMKHKYLRIAVYLLPLVAAVIYLGVDTADSTERLISCLGMAVLLIFGFVFSKHPRKVKWQPVLWGLGIQFLLGLFTIRWSVGRNIFQCIGDKAARFLSYADEGSTFVYGKWLIENGVFAFKPLSVIFFMSFMVQILYYYGAMQWIIIKLGWILQVLMGTTVCESVNAAASVFLGMSEAPLLVKPYIKDLTKSEIHALMTGGFATVAGTVLAAYINFGIAPAHLITASVMSAPAALCYSKLFYPETEESINKTSNIVIVKGDENSVLDAATKGALAAIELVLGIIANIIAFVAFIAFLNGVLSWLGILVGVEGLTLEYILGKLFIPLAWVMGVQYSECEQVARLIGLKTIVNEFIAYEQLGILKAENKISPRAEMIATYALCGFSNPGSIGILIGSLVTMAPNRRSVITEVAFRAFIAGSATCFLTACIAGMLMPNDYYATINVNSTMQTYVPSPGP